METHKLFIELWAKRYREIHGKEGSAAATRWFKEFIPKADQPRVFNAVKAGGP